MLGEFLDPGERIVTIEDAAELRLPQPHVVRLEARPPSLEGRGEVTIRALVRNALRMRPDRIVVGEVRGPEALDMLGALSCGHDGSLCTVHAGSPAEALRRLETLALMAGVGLPHDAIREQVADALHLVVCQARQPDGAPRRHRGRRGRARRRRRRRPHAVHAARRPPALAGGAVGPAGGTAGGVTALMAFAAAAAQAVAGVWELLAAVERVRVIEWVDVAVRPLGRARREGRLPSAPEQRRLAILVCGGLLAGGWIVAGPVVGAAGGGRRPRGRYGTAFSSKEGVPGEACARRAAGRAGAGGGPGLGTLGPCGVGRSRRGTRWAGGA